MITVIQKSKLEIIESKILDFDTIKNQLTVWNFLNEKVVFTYGCFDILDGKHIEYLCKAADLGHLVVGLKSDNSIRRKKGENHPVQDQRSRALVLAGLQFVKSVVIFDQDTPSELIQIVQPDFLAKNSGSSAEEIVGSDIVKAKGGEVVIL